MTFGDLNSESRWVVVDLTGSNCGPGWLSVELELDHDGTRSDEWLREGAAEHYAVPLDQVGPVTTEPTRPEL